MKGQLYAMVVLGLVGCCFGANRECYFCRYNSGLDVVAALTGNALGLASSAACEAPTSSAVTTTCNGQCQKHYIGGGDVVSISRSCVPVCLAVKCTTVGVTETCITCCDSDLCNGAGSVTFNLVAMFGLIATAWGLSK